MLHELPELPYSNNELEPYISAETLEYHHGNIIRLMLQISIIS